MSIGAYTVVSLTQHWYMDRTTRAWYRDAYVRDTNGKLLFVGIRTDLLPGEEL